MTSKYPSFIYIRSKLMQFAGLLVFASVCSSCEKQVNINLNTGAPNLVVEGQVEANQPPFVLLTTSLGFFSTVDLNTVQNSFVHNAVVKVSDGTKTVTLHEYSLDTSGSNKFYIYSIDSANIMFGALGKSYTLSVTYNGNTYTAVTKIPFPKPLDSVWVAAPNFTSKKTPLTAVELFANYTDPDTLGNYVRYFTKRNHGQFLPGTNVFSDEIINGNKVPDIALTLGYNDVPNANIDSLRYLFPGDTVVLKWSMIDKGVYQFWNTYNFAQRAVGNPFSSPINVQSNISNGALGVWAGYGSWYDTLIVK